MTSYHKLPHEPTAAKDSRVLVPFFFLFGELPCSHLLPSIRLRLFPFLLPHPLFALASASTPLVTATTPASFAMTSKLLPMNSPLPSPPGATNYSASVSLTSPHDTPPSPSSSDSMPPDSMPTTCSTSSASSKGLPVLP